MASYIRESRLLMFECGLELEESPPELSLS